MADVRDGASYPTPSGRKANGEEQERIHRINDGIDRAMSAAQPMLPQGCAIEAVTIGRTRKGTVKISFRASLHLNIDGQVKARG